MRGERRERAVRAFLVMVLLGALSCAAAQADINSDTWIRGASSVAANDDLTALFVNPAGLGMYDEAGFYGSLSMSGENVSGLALALKNGFFGLGYERRYLWQPCGECDDALRPGDDAVDTYTIGTAMGLERKWSLGFDYRWIRSQFGDEGKAETWDVGLMVRPTNYLSIGAALRNVSEPDVALESGDAEKGARLESATGTRATYVAGLAIRPFGNRVTLMADASVNRDQDIEDAVYTTGLEAELMDGVTVRGSLQSFPDGDDRDSEMSVGLFVNTTHTGAGVSMRTFGEAADDIVSYSAWTVPERMRSLVNPTGGVAEIAIEGPLSDFRSGWSLLGTPTKSAQQIIGDIRKASDDGSIECVLLRVRSLGRGFLGAPPAMVQEIRDAIVTAREQHGLKFVAFLEYGASTQDYFLASAADKIVMTPVSGIDGLGNYVEVMRYTGTTEKIGIEWDYLSAGKYKSTFHSIGAGPLTDDQRAEVQSLVDDNYGEIVKAVADGRGFTPEEAQALCSGRMFTPPQALEARLIDEIGVYEDAAATALALVRQKVPEDREDIELTSVRGWKNKAYDWNYGPVVAVIGAYGDIGVGKGGHDPLRGGESIGSETLIERLKRARRDPSVKAVVLRIDSGGGDGLASDLIWRETVKLAKKKPLIVSMADVAGSGGYYIAVAAERIFVEPLTITGSIGVVGMKPVLGPLYDKIDATRETFKRGEYSDMFSTARHATDEERAMAQGVIDWFYDDFTQKVADGRKLPPERVRELAQGRVYTGNQAVGNGLADELGGLSDAIDYACAKVGTDREHAKLVYYREGESWFSLAMGDVAARLGLYRLLDFGDAGMNDLLQLRAETASPLK
jgi:protease-4